MMFKCDPPELRPNRREQLTRKPLGRSLKAHPIDRLTTLTYDCFVIYPSITSRFAFHETAYWEIPSAPVRRISGCVCRGTKRGDTSTHRRASRNACQQSPRFHDLLSVWQCITH